MGWTRFLAKYGNMIDYAAPISAILEPEVIQTQKFSEASKRVKIAILHGMQDADV